MASTQERVECNERERRVLTHLASGRTREQIASDEGMSARTVNRIVLDLEQKLDAHTPFVLGAKAVRAGLIPAEPVGNFMPAGRGEEDSRLA